MILDTRKKTQLVAAVKDTFFSYLKLEFASQHLAPLFEGNNLVPGQDKVLNLHGKAYQVTFSQDETGKTQFTLAPAIAVNSGNQLVVKDVVDYTSDEALSLLCGTTFTIANNAQGQARIGLPVTVNHQCYELGGVDNLELWRRHFVTLKNIMVHLEHDDDIVPMLNGQTTGSGKTMLQALWYLILQKTEMNGVFALPNHLLPQFKKDFKRLLPGGLVDCVTELSQGEDATAAAAKLKAMADKNSQSQFVVASYERVLDEFFPELLAVNKDNTAFIFDECHKVMQDESRHVKLKKLAEEKLTMLLSATPDKETFYKICHGKTIARLSPAQKEREGKGKFPKIRKIKAKSLRQKLDETDIKGKARIKALLGLRIAKSIEHSHTSPAAAILDELRYTIDIDDPEAIDGSRASLRANLQSPAKRKILALVDSVDDVINLRNYINHTRNSLNYNFEVYHNGNRGNRDGVYAFFGLENTDDKIERAYQEKRLQEYADTLAQVDSNGLLDNGHIDLNQQLEHNVARGLVNLFLKDLLNIRSTDELEKDRREKPEQLLQQVKGQLALIYGDVGDDVLELQKARWQQKLTYHSENNPAGIDENGAEQVADIMTTLASKMATCDADEFAKYVDNWAFDTEYLDEVMYLRGVHQFANAHRTAFIMKGKEQSETAVKDDQPFFKFEEDRYLLYQDDGFLNPKAKKRKKTSLEVLDDWTREVAYHPDYNDDITEKVIDNYFHLDLVGMYVATPNKKAEGLNSDAATVISTINSPEDENNDPGMMIQGIGRLRGLTDETPYFFQCVDKGIKRSFDVNKIIETDDYFPQYYKANSHYRKMYAKRLGRRVADEIKGWYYANLDEKDDISEVELKWQSMRAVVRALRDINNKNGHNIKKSRAELATVLQVARKEMMKEQVYLKKPYGLSPFISFLGVILHMVAHIYYGARNAKIKRQFRRLHREAQKDLKKAMQDESKSPEEVRQIRARVVYGKLMQKRSFSNLTRMAFVGQEFKALLMREKNVIHKVMTKHLADYFTNDTVTQLNQSAIKGVLPLLARFFGADLRQEILRLGAEHQDWHSILFKYQDQMADFADNGEQLAKNMLCEIPALKKLLQHQPSQDYFSELRKLDAQVLTDPVKLKTALALVLPPESVAVVEPILEDQNKMMQLALYLMANMNSTELDVDQIIQSFKQCFAADHPEVTNIKSVIELCGDELEAVQSIGTNLMQHVEMDRLEAMMQNRMRDVIMHPKFYQFCHHYFGVFSQGELEVMLEAVEDDHQQAVYLARDLKTFLSMLKRKDFLGIATKFIQINREADSLQTALAEVPLNRMIETIANLAKDMIETQAHFHNMSAKGEQYGNADSKLIHFMGNHEMAELQTRTDGKGMEPRARKMFYLDGVRKGLPDAAKVSAFGSRKRLAHLKRVRNHVLTPLLWSSNRTKAGNNFINGWRKLHFKLHGAKSSESTYSDAEASTKPVKSITRDKMCDDDAFSIGKMMARLKRYNYEDVCKSDVKIDVVQSVFDEIDQREGVQMTKVGA